MLSSSSKLGRGSLKLRYCLIAQCFAQDLPRWVLRDRIDEYNPAGDPLRCGDLAVHESNDLRGCGSLARLQNDVCTRSLVVVAILD